MRSHKDEIALGAIFTGLSCIAAAIGYLVWNDESERGDLIVNGSTLEKSSSEETEVTLPDLTRQYNWYEDSHFVREHIRHYSDGSESRVRGYKKITGIRVNSDYESDRTSAA